MGRGSTRPMASINQVGSEGPAGRSRRWRREGISLAFLGYARAEVWRTARKGRMPDGRMEFERPREQRPDRAPSRTRQRLSGGVSVADHTPQVARPGV